MRGQCSLADWTTNAPCGPSAELCSIRWPSIDASPSREAAAVGPVVLPTRHSTTANPRLYKDIRHWWSAITAEVTTEPANPTVHSCISFFSV